MNLWKRSVAICFVFLCALHKMSVHGNHHPSSNIIASVVDNPPDKTVHHEGNMNPLHRSRPPSEGGEHHSYEDLSQQKSESTRTTPMLHTETHETSECPMCYLRREEAKRLRIEIVKRTILEKLQMSSPPNISRNIVLPKNAEIARFMNQYFNEERTSTVQHDEPRSSLEPSTRLEKMILFPKKPPAAWDITANTSYAFTFSEKLFNYDVKDASLHVHIRARRSNQGNSIHYLELRRVHNPPSGSNQPKIRYTTTKKIMLHPPKGQWVVLNMTAMAQEWIDYPEDHNVIQIGLIAEDGSSQDALLDTNIDSSFRKRSFLMMNIREKRHQRYRRGIDDAMVCTARSPVTTCCKYPMEIDFEEMGWDWVIAPRRYDANYCHGDCPRQYMLQYAHSQIVDAIGNPPLGATGPCCAPRTMSGLSMLHTDRDDNIQFTVIDSMTVDACHCA
nr:myostatin [Holothuria scabra]